MFSTAEHVRWPDGTMLDLLGVGIGPANLSLAALLAPRPECFPLFLERRSSLIWHEGMLLPSAWMQTPYLKDLVTLVDCRSSYSFLAFLQEKNRLYDFVNLGRAFIERKEFQQYLSWVATKLSSLRFSTDVESVSFADGFVTRTQSNIYHSRHLVLGVGQVPRIPAKFASLMSERVFHASVFARNRTKLKDKRILVIGGGQTGAEVFLDLLGAASEVRSVQWISRRLHFHQLDESRFTNEIFTPAFSMWFHGLKQDARAMLNREFKYTSDGISTHSLAEIFDRLYVLRNIEPSSREWNVRSGCDVVDVDCIGRELLVRCRQIVTGDVDQLDADIVILCTGYEYRLPSFLDGLKDRLSLNAGEIELDDDFSARWSGPPQNRIFVQNGARGSFGVADPNLSLLAWRSGRIANSVLGRDVYRLKPPEPIIDWSGNARQSVSRAVEMGVRR